MKNYIIYIILYMNKIEAKLKYSPNSFEIVKNGDYVLCSVSKKKILLEELSYWSVDLQEPYYSPVEAKIRFEDLKDK